jgi:hypothetical protein
VLGRELRSSRVAPRVDVASQLVGEPAMERSNVFHGA